jgi:hypothetical protein
MRLVKSVERIDQKVGIAYLVPALVFSCYEKHCRCPGAARHRRPWLSLPSGSIVNVRRNAHTARWKFPNHCGSNLLAGEDL